jgi:hypothetical protein
MTPSVHNYKYNRNEDYNQMPPDHYSEPGRYQDNRNDFNRQYNYMGNKTPNNYEDYKNQRQSVAHVMEQSTIKDQQ